MEFVQVVSVENMRKSDARTIAEHTPSAELMYRAAQGIFNSAKFVGRVAIVCGKGNNGGDGCAAARLWMQQGGRADVWLLKSPSQMKGDAGAFQRTAFTIIKPQCRSVPRRCQCHRRRLSRDLTL